MWDSEGVAAGEAYDLSSQYCCIVTTMMVLGPYTSLPHPDDFQASRGRCTAWGNITASLRLGWRGVYKVYGLGV